MSCIIYNTYAGCYYASWYLVTALGDGIVAAELGPPRSYANSPRAERMIQMQKKKDTYLVVSNFCGSESSANRITVRRRGPTTLLSLLTRCRSGTVPDAMIES